MDHVPILYLAHAFTLTGRKSRELQDKMAEIMGSELESVFAAIDTDGNGHLDDQELKKAFEDIGKPISDEKLEIAMKTIDANHDGKISLDEFKNIVVLVNKM